MDTSKIIKGVVSNGRYTVTAPIVKEDYGLYLKIEGVELPSTYEVDFSNSENNGTSVTMIGNADGVLIPHQFISTGKDVFAFLYHVGQDFGRTVYKFRIPNKVRPDRTNEEPTPEEQSVIDQVIASLNDAVDRAEDAEQAIEDMSVSATTLAEGASATVTKTESEGVVHLEFGIPRGATGAQGERGEKGDKGDTGATGAQGIQGTKGDTGADGYSPTVTITPITDGHRITITDADGEHSADVMDGQTPTVPVEDVQINGTSIVQDGVANVPVASSSNFGMVKINPVNGIAASAGTIYINNASESDLKTGTNEKKPVTANREHVAAFYGLAKAASDTTQSASSNAVGTYTEDAKIAIQKMLGLYREWELIADVTVEEDSVQIDITTDSSGQSFALREAFVRVWLNPSTTGANDYVSAKMLCEFNNGIVSVGSLPTLRYMANGAKTFMEYKAELIDGIGHAVGSATSSPGTTGTLNRIDNETVDIKHYYGFRIGRYGSSTTLIPAGTIIKICGIRA